MTSSTQNSCFGFDDVLRTELDTGEPTFPFKYKGTKAFDSRNEQASWQTYCQISPNAKTEHQSET